MEHIAGSNCCDIHDHGLFQVNPEGSRESGKTERVKLALTSVSEIGLVMVVTMIAKRLIWGAPTHQRAAFYAPAGSAPKRFPSV